MIGRAAPRRGSAAPLIAEEHLGALVVERGRVPELHVRIGCRIEPLRVCHVADVEQQAVAAAGAAGESNGGIHRDVMALHRAARRTDASSGPAAPAACSRATCCRRGDTFDGILRHARRVARRRCQGGEDTRLAHDMRVLGMREWYLNDLDPELLAVGIHIWRKVRTACELRGRPHGRRTGDVDVDVGLVAGILDHRVRVRTAAGLHTRDVLRVSQVRGVEDADAAEPLAAHGVLHALHAAIQAAAGSFTRHEDEVPIHGDVTLRAAADVLVVQPRRAWIGDVPHLVAVVVALDGILAGEGQVRMGDSHERLGRRHVGEQAHVPRSFRRGLHDDFFGCVPGIARHGARTQAHARIG